MGFELTEPAGLALPSSSRIPGRRDYMARLRVAKDERDRARDVAVALEQQCAELAGALRRVLAVCDHAAKVSPSERMSVYVGEIVAAVGTVQL